MRTRNIYNTDSKAVVHTKRWSLYRQKGEILTREELLQIAKPILFNTEMVRAILEDRKTVTRRVVRIPSYVKKQEDGLYTLFVEGTSYVNQTLEEIEDYLKKPCKPGDVLYVRETWTLEEFYDDEALIRFKDGGNIGIDYKCEGDTYSKLLKYADNKWNPSLFMPKEAARIFLKVKSVRVERLQDITENDAYGEGTNPWDDACYENNGWTPTLSDPDSGGPCDIISGFHKLWNSTIKKADIDNYGWDANPYVWVIEFERIYPD